MTLHPGEPAVTRWFVRPLAEVLADLGPPRILPIDGGSSSGKTTLASRIAGGAVVHTDDIAWNHSRFGWDDLLVGGIIEPFRRGDEIRCRPPQWDARGRDGAVELPGDAPLLVIEGVGSARPSLRPLVDGSRTDLAPELIAVSGHSGADTAPE